MPLVYPILRVLWITLSRYYVKKGRMLTGVSLGIRRSLFCLTSEKSAQVVGAVIYFYKSKNK